MHLWRFLARICRIVGEEGLPIVTAHHATQVRINAYPLRPRLRKALAHGIRHDARPLAVPHVRSPLTRLRPTAAPHLFPVNWLCLASKADALEVGLSIWFRVARSPTIQSSYFVRSSDLAHFFCPVPWERDVQLRRLANAGLLTATRSKLRGGWNVVPIGMH